MKRQLNRIVELSEANKASAAIDLARLERLLMLLETECAAVAPSFRIVRSINQYPGFSAEAK